MLRMYPISRWLVTALLFSVLPVGAPQAETVDGANNTLATGSLLSLTTGIDNSAYGVGALTLLTTGNANSAYGRFALSSLTGGSDNSAFGMAALRANTTGTSNNAFGAQSLAINTIGLGNNAFGNDVLAANTSGMSNSGFGDEALMSNTVGYANAAFGFNALRLHLTGNANSAFGSFSLARSTTAAQNTAIGFAAMFEDTTGSANTALGSGALKLNITGSRNTAIGKEALFNTKSDDNLALGNRAGFNVTTGIGNVIIANPGDATDTRVIRIGVQGRQRSTFIAGIRGSTVTDGIAVVVKNTGQLGVQTSSRRFKEDIRPMATDSDRLMQLQPVTFRYKAAETDGSKPVQYGLIAEDVAKVFPELVGYDQDGQPDAVAYQTLSSLLLNEFQKQHRDIEKSQAVIAKMQRESRGREAELMALRGEVAELKQLTTQRLATQKANGRLVADAP